MKRKILVQYTTMHSLDWSYLIYWIIILSRKYIIVSEPSHSPVNLAVDWAV